MTWLSWMEKKLCIPIQHAKKGGEVSVGNHKLDGMSKSEGTNIAFEFHGCFWHGCPKCFSRDTINPVSQKTMGDLYEETINKKRALTSKGFEYCEMWECQWNRLIKDDAEVSEFMENFEAISPLNPRDAFMGGRTETFKLYQEAIGCTIEYVDFTSLYPYINKYGK